MGATGVMMRDAVKRTGLNERQLRYRIQKKTIRSTKRGKYRVFHPQDVERLEVINWDGNPVQEQERAQA